MAMLGTVLLAGCSKAPATMMPMEQAEKSAPVAMTGDARHPVVVELFQSQGCSSCPPANTNVNAVAGREGVLALSYAVTYWDRLGWKDTFAQPAFTERQQDYAKRAKDFIVATPQVVVNGRQGLVGSNKAALDKAIAAAGPLSGGPVIDHMGSTLVVGQGRPSGTATVFAVYYDPRSLSVPIGAGENTGRTLPHRNIVRSLTRLGEWSGAERKYALPAASDRSYRLAVLVQNGAGGPLIAARSF